MVDKTLQSLREEGVIAAKNELAAILAAETVAEEHLAEAEAEMWRRRDEAMEDEDDTAVEAFAAWLPQGRKQIAAAQALLDRAAADVIRVRAALAHAEISLTAIIKPESAA